EGHRGLQRRVAGDQCSVDPELVQFAFQEGSEVVVADLSDDAGSATVPGCGDRDIGRGTAQILAEGGDVGQRDTDVVRIDVNADASEGEYVVGHADRRPFVPRSSCGPARRSTVR